MSKNVFYKNVNSGRYVDIKNIQQIEDYKYLISYNEIPHLIVNDLTTVQEYMSDHIQHLYNNIFYNNSKFETYFHKPQIIETDNGYQIVESNPYSVIRYDNIIASLTFKKVNSI